MQARTEGNNGNVEEELTTRALQIQNKRFYLDVKQNQRGRFIKIAEVGLGGRKSRILMSMGTAAAVRDNLETMVTTYNKLAPHSSQNVSGNGLIRSDTITKDNRRYYLDLKENNRGRFLRLTMMSPMNRSQIAIPAQGIVEVRDCLRELLKEYGTEDDDGEVELPESKSLRTDNKMFYFDVGSNHRGVFMRISEVRANYRTAINIPDQSWTKVRDIVNEMIDKMTAAGDSGICSDAKSPDTKSSKSGGAEKPEAGDTKAAK